MACKFFRTAGLAAGWLVLTMAVCVQAQQPAARFDVSGYAVEGAPLLKSEDFSRIVAPFIGRQKTAADVQKAQQALQQAYLDLGYCSVQVTLPKAEPDAGTVTLKLVQTVTPISKDCLPMVVLDKGAPPVPVAPGEVAIRPLSDATQAAAEPPPPAEASSRIARAPLKPLQDRPAPARPIPQVQSEIASSLAPRDTPADVTVQSLAQAPPQPGLIVTPAIPAQVEKPTAAALTPPTPIASTPVVVAAKPIPEVPVVPTAQPAPGVQTPPVVAAPVAPTIPAVAPSKPVSPAPATVTTSQPESPPAPKLQPVIEIPQEQIAAKPQNTPAPVAAQSPIEAPAPAVIVASPVKPAESVAAPSAKVVEPVQSATDAPLIAEAPRLEPPMAPQPQPIVELPKEVIAGKPEPAVPAILAERSVEKTVPDLIAAAPAKPEPAMPPTAAPRPAEKTAPDVIAAASVASGPVAPTPVPPVASVEPIKPAAPAPQPVIEAPKVQVAEKVEQATSPTVAPPPKEKPAQEVIAAVPVVPEPVAPVPAPRRESIEPVRPAAAVTSPSIAAPPMREQVQPPLIESPKEPVAAKPDVPQAPPPTVVQRKVEKPAPNIIAVAPVMPGPVMPEPVTPVPAPAVAVEPVKPAMSTPQPVIEMPKEQTASKPKSAPVPAESPGAAQPALEVAAVAPVKSEPLVPAPAPPVAVVEPAKPTVPVPAIVAAAQPESPPVPAAQPVIEAPKEQVAAKLPSSIPPTPPPAAEKSVAPDVEVRPLAGAIAVAPEPREPAKPTVERAPVRTLQDRQQAAAQEQTSRVAEASEESGVKPSPVVVQSPTVAVQAEPAASAEPSVAAPAALKFDIDRYLVEGNTLLNAAAIGKVLAPYTGKQKDFSDVQRALEALQVAYQKLGWGVVQVTLPEQELERGEVRFEVTETRVGKIDVQGNEYFSEANIRRSVPSLKEGETPNSLAMARSLRVANESSVKQSQVSLKAGSKDGEVDATIKVVDDNPRKYSLSLDNTGTSQTGFLRLGLGFQHSNLWDRDHQFTFQYITNPEHVNQVTVLGAGYHIPLYGRGDSIDFILGYSDVDSGVVQQLFNVSGAGLILLGRYNMNLNRIEDYEHKLTFGLDYKAFQSRVLTTSGVPLVPDITLHPVSIAYSGELRSDQNAFNFYTSLSYNPFEGGNDAAQSDFRASRGAGGGASAEYVIWRAGVNYQRLLPEDWTFRFAANAQTTGNALVAGEQFGVGGANNVRGFNERVYSNDKGHQATFELITPDIAGKIGFAGGRLRFLAFYDTANLSRNFIQPGEQTGLGIDSVGLGLRLTFRERLSVRMDYAQVLHDGGQDAGLPNGRRNSNTLHASALFVY